MKKKINKKKNYNFIFYIYKKNILKKIPLKLVTITFSNNNISHLRKNQMKQVVIRMKSTFLQHAFLRKILYIWLNQAVCKQLFLKSTYL